MNKTMKTRSNFFSLFFAATAITFLASCSGNKDESGHREHEAVEESTATQELTPEKPQFTVDEKFRNQLQEVFTAYVDLKNALVSSESGKVKDEAEDANEALAKVDMKLVEGAAHNDWMTYLAPMKSSLENIQASEDLEVQRKAFSTLSENLYKSIKAFGLDGKEAFYEYCPMAFNNEGAYWLSEDDKIKNPYFGEKMLTCGEVTERLQ
jgi:Cu(I)/Ag(I) efflux system membrane fusion protein